ncbi:MAG TPA: 1-deoxy-D-xylulose-5-phosphate reductoisomerase, partial [Planctomycetota bacterium]|nr:1-deoxy-D-xylulose-5-phosphate reductoisomerase [Planctomycetota bacterium]
RFLDGEIRFPDIARICAAALEAIPPGPANRLEEVLAADARARTFASSPILC